MRFRSFRKRRLTTLAFWPATLAVCLLLGFSGSGANSRGVSLQVVKNQLVDADGHPLRLLGVNRSGAEYACIQRLGIFAGPTDQRSIAAMVSWHINAVRVPLNEQCWLGLNRAPAAYSGARYREAIRAFVSRLHAAGMYVILDLHWNAPGNGWATGQRQMADLDHGPAFWSSVARTFKQDQAVVFDLYNEPRGIGWPCWRYGCVVRGGWRTAGMQTLLDAVRRTGADQPVIATGPNSGNDLSAWLRYRPDDPAHQLVAGFHAYNYLACNTRACWAQELGPIARTVPVVASELGEGDCSHRWIDRFMAWADTRGVSYLGWSWNPSGCVAPALVRSWDGRPTSFGAGLRAHLGRLQRSTSARLRDL